MMEYSISIMPSTHTVFIILSFGSIMCLPIHAIERLYVRISITNVPTQQYWIAFASSKCAVEMQKMLTPKIMNVGMCMYFIPFQRQGNSQMRFSLS